MEPIEKLDYVLEYLKSVDKTQVLEANLVYFDINPQHGEDILSKDECLMAVDKLIRDGYVVEKTSTMGITAITISFEGSLFQGYKNQAKDLLTKRRLARFQSWTLAIGTGLAGLYGLFEITKWIFHHYHWTFPF